MAKVLSVIVPAYNMSAYLPKCLESLVVDDRALFRKLDVVVVNDGSNDTTGEIADEYARKYPDVFRAVHKENGHYGSCVNRGLVEASGTYVKILDADDSVDTKAFEALLHLAESESELGASGADLLVTEYAEVGTDGAEINRSHFDLNRDQKFILDDIAGKVNGFPILSICYKLCLLRDIAYRQTEGTPYTDLEWIIEPMAHVRSVRYLPCAVTRYLVGRQGQSVEEKTIARDYYRIMQVTQGIVKRYTNNLARSVPSSRIYYSQSIRRIIRDVYFRSLVGYGKYSVSGDIASFDSFIRTIPAVENDIESITGGTRMFQIPLVVVYRQGSGAWRSARLKMKIALALARMKRYVGAMFRFVGRARRGVGLARG